MDTWRVVPKLDPAWIADLNAACAVTNRRQETAKQSARIEFGGGVCDASLELLPCPLKSHPLSDPWDVYRQQVRHESEGTNHVNHRYSVAELDLHFTPEQDDKSQHWKAAYSVACDTLKALTKAVQSFTRVDSKTRCSGLALCEDGLVTLACETRFPNEPVHIFLDKKLVVAVRVTVYWADYDSSKQLIDQCLREDHLLRNRALGEHFTKNAYEKEMSKIYEAPFNLDWHRVDDRMSQFMMSQHGRAAARSAAHALPSDVLSIIQSFVREECTSNDLVDVVQRLHDAYVGRTQPQGTGTAYRCTTCGGRLMYFNG